MIDMNKKYKTRSGLPVRILCVDRKHKKYPVTGLIFDGEEYISYWKSDGRSYIDVSADLIEVSPYEDFKVDDLCVVQKEYCDPIFRYFGMEVSGMAYCFEGGKTSFTATKDDLISWINCRKATPEEIQTKTIKG